MKWTMNVVHDVVQGAVNWNGFGPHFTDAAHFTDEAAAHSLFFNNVLIKNRANR